MAFPLLLFFSFSPAAAADADAGTGAGAGGAAVGLGLMINDDNGTTVSNGWRIDAWPYRSDSFNQTVH